MEIKWQVLEGNRLSAKQLHDILALRSAIFVVEQTCPFQDIDGLDLLDDTLHVAGYSEDKLIAYTRVLNLSHSAEAIKITRVIVDGSVRGQKLGVKLMEKTLSEIHALDLKNLDLRKSIKLSAQSHLQKFYASFGFDVISEEYLEDDIPHVDMQYVGPV
ncbi:GNAT family N-acetyltransferase [Rouxiella sp. T17]|uniref:GNAT family N-acetyltransferase n=1 Tax=Rouxiella sp. T17 TaxID=3085684 RepID=UPI002FC7F014